MAAVLQVDSAFPALARVPTHVAIIMDGNGRWAQARGLPRLLGHRQGVENIRPILNASVEFGIKYLTIYAFSTENWDRPLDEVRGLMSILEQTIQRETPELHKNGVRIRHLGRMDGLSKHLQKLIGDAVTLTANNERLNLNVAFNYGGRAEIIDAVKRIVADGIPVEAIDEKLFTRYLYTGDTPDPDLVIRTAGEMRLSNYLIWQSAYAEYYATPAYWPDFGKAELYEALQAYNHRDRRFGKVLNPVAFPRPAVRTRLISAILLFGAASVAIYFGGWFLLALFGTGMLIAAYEYFNMTRLGNYKPLVIPALVLIACLFLNSFLRPTLPYDFAPLILVIAIAFQPLWELTRSDHHGFLLDWALMVLGVTYIGILGSFLFAMRSLQDGAQLLFIALLATWLTDIFAYLSGRIWGKDPFFPEISPKKTRQGAIGGIVAGTLTVGVLGSIFGMNPILALIGGLIIALLTTAGDLTESLIKRNLGVKDSGTLIAGHGGVFDRLDSMFIPVTFAYFYFTLLLGYK